MPRRGLWRAGRAALAALVVLSACNHPRTSVTPRLDPPAPDSFQVAIETTQGRVTIVAERRWAPHGVDRFYALVRAHYYDGAPIYRVVPKFVAQFGLAADPRATATFKPRTIPDDSVRQSNVRGIVSFASAGPGTRTTQLFINLVDNARLDAAGGGYPPIARVVEGMDVVDRFNAEYEGTMPRRVQDSISLQGDAYVRRAYPRLDHIRGMKLVREWKH